MLADSILVDFMSRLDLNISMLLYGLVSTNLNKAIMKAKIIEIGQKNTSGIIQVNAKMMQLKTENQILYGNKLSNYSHKHSLNHSHSNNFNKIIYKDLADEEIKKKGETLTGINQRMVNQRGLS